jgi:hypothetical protein
MWCKTISVTQLRRWEWFHFVSLCPPSLSLLLPPVNRRFINHILLKRVIVCWLVVVSQTLLPRTRCTCWSVGWEGSNYHQTVKQMERKRSVQEMKNDVEVWKYNQLHFVIQTNIDRRPNNIIVNVPRSIILTINIYEVAASIRSIRHIWNVRHFIFATHLPSGRRFNKLRQLLREI